MSSFDSLLLSLAFILNSDYFVDSFDRLSCLASLSISAFRSDYCAFTSRSSTTGGKLASSTAHDMTITRHVDRADTVFADRTSLPFPFPTTHSHPPNIPPAAPIPSRYPYPPKPVDMTLDTTNIPFNVSEHYEVVDVIGEGAYGVVV